MGGVWFGNIMTDQPSLWQQAFSTDNTTFLVNYKTPCSTISNSDLEKAGHIVPNNVLASLANIESANVSIYTDSTSASQHCPRQTKDPLSPITQLPTIPPLQALH